MTAQRRDRPIRSQEEQHRLLFDANPCPMVNDVTDPRRTEQQLLATTQRLQALMQALPVGVIFSGDAHCEHLTGNPALLTQFEATTADTIPVAASASAAGATGPRVRFFHEGRELSASDLPMQRAAAEDRFIPPMELEIELPSGRRWFAEASGAPLHDAGRVIGGVAITVDITRRKQAEKDLTALAETLERRVAERTRSLEMLHDIATMANQSPDTEQAIQYCLQRVAMYHGWCFGHALLPAAAAPDELVPGYAWYAQDPERFRRFREATFGLRLRRGQGLSGRVLASGRLEWSTDLEHDLLPPRGGVARELGLGTAVACPVLLGRKVAAVLEFFSDQVLPPNGRMADAMLGAGLQLGRVLERAAFEEHLLTIAEDMQRGITQDLHDDVGQELTGLGLKAATLVDMLAPATTPAGKLAADIAAALERTHAKIRRLCRGMLPLELEAGLLASALEQLAAATSENARLKCTFTCPHPDPVFDSRVSTHLYRIAQEAVANAVRHSRARSIRLTLAQEDGETVLRIEDDGKGLARGRAQAGGMGLRTMRYRASLIGGKLETGPGVKGGTQVVCRVVVLPPPEHARRDT